MPAALTTPEPKPTEEVAALKPAPKPSLQPGRLWRATAFISAAFTIVVAVGMLVGYQRNIAEDPLRVSRLNELREKLQANPKDEQTKKVVRQLDLEERQRYFKRLSRSRAGAWMLALGTTVFVVSSLRARKRTVYLPRPLAAPAEIERATARARTATVIAGGAVVCSIVIVAVMHRRETPSVLNVAATAADPAQPAAITPEFLSKQWPRFRGWDGSGVSSSTNVPVTWNIETGENIAWKSATPLTGQSSPVVWGNRLFVTGSSDTEREVFCFDVATGALLWRVPARLVSADAVKEMEIPKLTGAASATVAADDKRVYAIFGTGELLAIDHSGSIVWTKNFGKLENQYGHATSLVMHRDRLIVQLDQASDEDGKSRLYSIDGATGNIVWQQRRMLPSSWATPLVVNAAGKDQIVALGEPWLISYNAADGKELWKYNGIGSDITPSPIFAAGFVFAISPSQALLAIRPDGSGDITKTHVSWMIEQQIPDITSPVSNGELLFLVESHGGVVCLDAKTGAKVWEHSFEGEFQASPVIAGSQLYVFSTEGDVYTLKVGREMKEMGKSKLAEPVRASPAFAGDRMFVRGATNLFCIGTTSNKGANP